jgi:hypothetical protein
LAFWPSTVRLFKGCQIGNAGKGRKEAVQLADLLLLHSLFTVLAREKLAAFARVGGGTFGPAFFPKFALPLSQLNTSPSIPTGKGVTGTSFYMVIRQLVYGLN